MLKRTTRRGRWIAAPLLVGLLVAGCAKKSTTEEDTGRATITPIEGTDRSSVGLSSQAAERIGLELATVEQGTGTETEIPYSAVLYDPEGNTWAFVQTDELTFLRKAITVDHIDGDVAYLTAGPDPGTKIVTVGATELYGAEIGVGDE